MKLRVDYAEWNRERKRLVRETAVSVPKTHRRDRLRTEEERFLLRRSTLDAIRRREEAGKLVWTGPRRAEWGAGRSTAASTR